MMKILILGGTGLIGGALERHLSADHEVECVGRSAFASQDVLNKLVQDKDLIIKLSGANIVKRWNAAYKQEIWDSRIETSKQLKIALDFLTNKPRIFCASAVGFYPESLCEQPFNEDCKYPGTGFLSDLVVAWEKSSESLAKEVLIFRFGVVLSVKDGDVQALNYFVATKYTEALQAIATADNEKLVLMPLEASALLGSLGGIGELVKGVVDNNPKT